MRILVYSLCLLLFSACLSSQTTTHINRSYNPDQPLHRIYIGTYTQEGSEGIYSAVFDCNKGTLTNPILAAQLKNPSFQTLSSDQKYLWSVCETDGDGAIASFSVDTSQSLLQPVSVTSSKGEGACFVAFHNMSGSVCAANYGSGSVIRQQTREGTFSGDYNLHLHTGTGPKAERQEAPHAHCIKFDLQEKYGYSCDLGADKIYVYQILNDSLCCIDSIITTPGSGPRHIDFSPNGECMAVINELNNTIATYTASKKGIFNMGKQTIATLPASFKAFSKAADIHFTPDGKYLYASNRGHNSIAIFDVKANMELESKGWQTNGCNWVRNFAIDPSGHYLLAANRNNHRITILRINPKTGLLAETGKSIAVPQPVCITFIK